MKKQIYKLGLAAIGWTRSHRLVERRTRGLGAILMLHHVRPDDEAAFQPNRHLEITPDFLERLIRHLKGSGRDFVSLDEVRARLEGGSGTDRPFVCLTLDDGYRDNVEIAWPIFRAHGVPFAVYVCTGFVDRYCGMWWRTLEEAIRRADALTLDLGRGPETFRVASTQTKSALFDEIAAYVHRLSEAEAARFVADLAGATGVDAVELTDRALATWTDLKPMADDPLCTIGAHTITHPMLARLDRDTARSEMADSAARIAEMLEVRPRHFAYPYGYASVAGEREFALAADLGFATAVTTRPGVVEPAHAGQPTALPRVSVNGLYQSLLEMEVLVSGAPFALMRRVGMAA